MKTNNNAIDSSKSSTPSQVETTKAAIYIDGKVVENWPDQLSGLVNRQFWQIATKHSMEICLKMSQHTNQIDDDDGNICCMPVECNPPTIVGVFTFEKFNAKIFPGIPVVLEVQSLYDTHVIVDWYVDEKQVMKNSPCYIPTEQDANKRLSVVLTPTRGDHDGRGYQEAYQFSELVSERRPENDLLSIRSDWLKKVTETEISCVKDEKQGIDEENGVSKTQLRVLSYNILADQNAFSMENPGTPYFPWTTVELMDRKRRSPLILHEILSYGADLICLQEVDELVYDTILRPALNHYNYQGFFSMKMATGTREGCAMFFSLKTFQRCKPDELLTIRISDIINAMSSARDIAPEWEENVKPVVDLLKSCPELQETIDNLAHVVQIARLKDLDGRPIIVANTHLFFHPLADHVRVLQCFAIAYQLSIETTMFGAAPFIICGDFNTDLDDCAAILVNRIFPKNFRDVQHCLNTFTWKEEQHCVENDSRHQVNFPELRLPDSVPVIVSGHHTEHPEFTHYVVEYKATLDHILMSSSTKTARLDPIRQAPLPTLSQVTRHTAMPSISFPSDHCSVLVDAIWTKDASS
jgi:mRNA deadenylase 3'-5' endonuclease subunit Ccr4